jgi:arabinoxylan arabinofuranohydrolase
MTTKQKLVLVAVCMAIALPRTSIADNPIVQTNYTADPAPMLYGDRLYVHTTHDEDVTVNDFFTMNDWRVYSTADMVNWTDHGSPLSYKSFTWGTGDAWAGQCIPRNGKFYFYVPMNNSSGTKIGVAVGDSPIGPFKDALGKPLLSGGGYIDPTVFIDSDNQAYLYWGNPNLYYVKLNENMTSFAGSATQVQLTVAGFGKRTNTDRATAYEEGPWFTKRGSLYYMIYPADGTPEKISYSTSSGPTGPWTYRGDIMAKQTGAGASFTNHPGIVDFKGKSYFFYHNGALPGGGGYKRSVCIEEFTYGEDGTIPTLKMTKEGPAPVAILNPFQQVEAETIAFSSGLKTEVCTDTGGGINVSSISNGDYIKVRNIDFADGVTSFDARVSSAASSAKIELHLDSQTGTSLGTCDVSGASSWTTKTCAVSGGSGKHDLFMKFVGGSGDLFKFNWWKFSGPRMPDPTGGADGGAGGTGGQGTTAATGGNGGSDGGRSSSGTTGRGGSTTGGAAGGAGGTTTGSQGGANGGQSTSAGRSAGQASGGAVSSGASNDSNTGAGGLQGSSSASSSTSPGTTGGCSCRFAPARGHAWLPLLAMMLLVPGARRRFNTTDSNSDRDGASRGPRPQRTTRAHT